MRILIVEDEHTIASALKKGLEQERYAVDLAYDGETGFDLASEGVYDLLILDIMLPKLDGVELARYLRAKNIHTPILMLTARGSLSDKVSGLNSGADDYLVKPFAFEELLARIKALTRRPHKSLSPILKVGDLVVNTTLFTVSVMGENVELSKKEFSLLEYLVRNQGVILTKSQIISHVWDYDADILDNTIEVYIRNLRQKIEKPFNKSFIRTVRGFGYKIVSE